MVETAAKVYDILYPSPIPLRDLSAIVVAIELWRLDLSQYLKVGDFGEDFYDHFEPEPRITLRKVIPDVPSVIHRITEKYLQNLVSSTDIWLHYNYDCVFRYHRDNHNAILKDFNDIACDHDGTIHYVRTAQRMMLCDRISIDEKFKIACAYCFEDDLKRIGLSVQSKVNLEEIDYSECPPLYYWVCRFRNELDKIPNEESIPIGDLMLKDTPIESRSSFEYFWNLAGLESRYQKAVTLCMDDNLSFCGRFVLPKLDEEQLSAFVDEKGCDLIYYLWSNLATSELILGIWSYLKDKINETNFVSLIEKMLSDETKHYVVDDSLVEKSEFDKKYHSSENLTTCCEIWTTAADKLKRPAIKQILPNKWLFEKPEHDINQPREIRLLLTILQDATSEDRSVFWRENWKNLLCSTLTKDLHRIMKFCFTTEDEIERFKKNTMAKYENIAEMVTNVLRQGYFGELSNVLDFICSEDEQSKMGLKQKCLQSNFLGERSILCIDIICEWESLHDFIDDAYADQADDFRNQFLSAPGTEYQLLFCMKNGYFFRVKELVESFASLGDDVESLKKRFVDELRGYLIEGSVWEINVEGLKEFLLWCLGSDDRVAEFKQSISPDLVLLNMLKNVKSSQENVQSEEGLLSYPRTLDDFLTWYFDNQEEMNGFKVTSEDIFRMFGPPPRRRF